MNLHRTRFNPRREVGSSGRSAIVPALGTAIVLVGALACGQQASPGPDGEAAGAAPTTSAQPAPGGAAMTAAGITFDLPKGWLQQPPESPMRLGQATIPGAGGEGLLTIFFFGTGGGGSAQMNIDRWVDQIVAEPGAEAVVSSETRGDYQVSYVEHRGTLKASRMGTFPSTDQPDYQLSGAVVEGPGGPWFFKAVGPQSTLEEQNASFRSMIASIRPADA